MAKPRKRGNSYQLRATINGETKTTTWKIPAGLTEKQAEKQAQKEQDKFEELVSMGINTDRITFQTVSEQFLEARKDELKETTLQNYKDGLRLINQRIGHYEIKALRNKGIIRDYIKELQQPYKTASGVEKQRSAKTITNYFRIISTVLSFACEMDYLEDNPCTQKGIRLPKQAEKKNKAIPIDVIHRYLEAMENAPLQDKVFFFLGLYSGARSGELLGLSWDDIDFDAQEINISSNCQYIPYKGIIFTSPKTASSARTIELPTEVFDMLRQLRIQQAENRLKAGVIWKANPENPTERYCENHAKCNKPCTGFCSKNCRMFKDSNRVFVNEIGHPIHPDMPRKNLQKIGKKAGLPQITVHRLRHTVASLAIANGDPITQISAFLGHASPKVTNDVYIHELRTAGRAKKLNTNIGKVLKIAE